ncbi:unnamed protein product, partial [Timema podura]|nr:unnamed protein product [Timema podura]
MTTSTPEKQDGLKALNNAINKIDETIVLMGGVFAIKMALNLEEVYAQYTDLDSNPSLVSVCLELLRTHVLHLLICSPSPHVLVLMQPKVVTATDEAELARQMERAEAENAEVAGDDDEEEEIEGQVYSGGEEEEAEEEEDK